MTQPEFFKACQELLKLNEDPFKNLHGKSKAEVFAKVGVTIQVEIPESTTGEIQKATGVKWQLPARGSQKSMSQMAAEIYMLKQNVAILMEDAGLQASLEFQQ